jgi:hypothetical protein
MAANSEYVYRLYSPNLSEINLITSKSKESKASYYYGLAMDGDEGFVLCDEGKVGDTDFHLYKFNAGDVYQDSGIDVSTLERVQTDSFSGALYKIRSDDRYWYIYNNEVEMSFQAGGIAGIIDKAENRQVFRNMSSGLMSNGQSLIYFRDDRMIFSDKIDHEPNAFSMIDSEGYVKNYVTFNEGYQYDLNNIYYDETHIYALLQKQKSIGSYSQYNSLQVAAESDALVSVDADTGSVTTLYEAESRIERIIGFANQKIYLFQVKTNSIDCLDLATEIREEFLRFEGADEYKSYAFEMCGKKLFVWGGEGLRPGNFVGAFDYLP